jgi:hypothetical protein
LLFYLHLTKSTNYAAHRYAVFSALPSNHSSSVQISPSTPCSQTYSVYIPHLMSETKLHTQHNHRQNYSPVYPACLSLSLISRFAKHNFEMSRPITVDILAISADAELKINAVQFCVKHLRTSTRVGNKAAFSNLFQHFTFLYHVC